MKNHMNSWSSNRIFFSQLRIYMNQANQNSIILFILAVLFRMFIYIFRFSFRNCMLHQTQTQQRKFYKFLFPSVQKPTASSAEALSIRWKWKCTMKYLIACNYISHSWDIPIKFFNADFPEVNNHRTFTATIRHPVIYLACQPLFRS